MPGNGTISNLDLDLLAVNVDTKKDDAEHLSPLDFEDCEALFTTLAEWNDYLEAHISLLCEDQEEIEIGGPSL